MSYYMGDYPRRMSRGDPGFFSFLKGAASSLAGFIPGVGPIISKGIGMIPSGVPGIVGRSIEAGRGAMIKAGGAIVKHPALSAAGAAGTIGAVAGAAHLVHAHRLSTLARTGVRKRPRMNVCNPRALRRAIRRTHGFAKLAMKTIHLVHPKKKARFGGFKKKRKR